MMKKILLTTALAWALLAPAIGQADLPDLGEPAEASLSLAEENKIGSKVWRDMLEVGFIVDDAEVSAYLNDLGSQLSGGVKLAGVHFTYFCVDDANINAFAMPGGYIGINIGLLLASQSEGELASVMGHETAHVAQRHIARMKAASEVRSPLLLLGSIVAAAAASRAGSSQAAVGAISASMGLDIASQLAFSRDFEREADRVGMQYLSQAGFDVRNMATFFQKLQRPYSDLGSAYAFLMTHPVTTERIAEAENRALDFPVKMREDSVGYLLVREKLRVRVLSAADKAKAVDYYDNALKQGRYLSEGAQWYGLARARLLQRDTQGAQQALNTARSKLADHPMLYSLEADIATERQNWATAREALRRGEARFSAYRPLQLAQIDLAINSGDSKTALALLKSQLVRYPEEASLYRSQAKIYADKDPLRYHAALGDAFYYERRYQAAMDQYQRASEAKGEDFYLRSSIEARMRQLQKLSRDELK